jgi:hypothetical protein
LKTLPIPSRPPALSPVLVQAALVMLLGCGDPERPPGAAAELRDLPARGEVWHLAAPGTQASAPGELLSLLLGLQSVVVDGDELFAGRRQFTIASSPAGGAQVTIDGQAIEVERSPDQLVLRFPDGQLATLVPHPASR